MIATEAEAPTLTEQAELKEVVRAEALDRRNRVQWDRGGQYVHREPELPVDLAARVARYLAEWRAWRAGVGPNPLIAMGEPGQVEEDD